MNALQPNPETGFLESSGYSGYQFNSERKVKFLEIAHKYFDETGNMPNVSSLCTTIGIHNRTFEEHLKADESFASAWRALRLKGKHKLESKMYEYAQNKGGYMHMITWLRKEFPEEYNPELRIINNVDDSKLKGLFTSAIEGELVERPSIISTPKAIEKPSDNK